MKKPIALVDLDGTLADFQGAMQRDLARLRAPEEPPIQDWDDNKQPPHLKARWDMIKRQPDWWFDLEYMPSGQWLVKTLTEIGFRIHILTRAPKRLPSAWEQKVRWVHKHVPGTDITIAPNKSMVYGKVLVDDWVDYVDPWLRHRPRGLVIMPSRPWNEGYQHPQVIRHEFGVNDSLVHNVLWHYHKSFKGEAE